MITSHQGSDLLGNGGISGSGKTTLSRLAPPDVVLQTDEISYVWEVRCQSECLGRSPSERHTLCPSHAAEPRLANPKSKIENLKSHEAKGTVFASELPRVGKNLRASLVAL